jgi:hypothetical protein
MSNEFDVYRVSQNPGENLGRVTVRTSIGMTLYMEKGVGPQPSRPIVTHANSRHRPGWLLHPLGEKPARDGWIAVMFDEGTLTMRVTREPNCRVGSRPGPPTGAERGGLGGGLRPKEEILRNVTLWTAKVAQQCQKRSNVLVDAQLSIQYCFWNWKVGSHSLAQVHVHVLAKI